MILLTVEEISALDDQFIDRTGGSQMAKELAIRH